jgi:hypothetical protein
MLKSMNIWQGTYRRYCSAFKSPQAGLRNAGPKWLWLPALLLFQQLRAEPEATNLTVQFSAIQPASAPLRLRGGDAKQQIIVTAQLTNGALSDYTRRVTYETTPTGVVQISKSGMLTPLANGTAAIKAVVSNGLSTTFTAAVEHFKDAQPINFANQIVPIFTKTGCNGGGCHGKSSGQNGFRLSLLGFEPDEDYEHLVKEARGRRLFPASPERSLMLLKGAAILPHGGGKRLDVDSDDYKLLVRWVAQGMPRGSASDPTVVGIDVVPQERTMSRQAGQQLIVLARYSDGTVQDVTRSALYEPNDKDMASVSETGLVTAFDRPGDVSVMVRYQAKVAVFQAIIPLGAPVDNLPTPRNFVDELVFKKLKKVGMPPSPLCDDATFARRAAIDIAGRLPTLEETTKFLEDNDPAKRDKWIEHWLASPEYADYFANKWAALLRNKRSDSPQRRGTYGFHAWIRDSVFENKSYDRFVREILAASGEMSVNPPVAWYRQVRDTTAQLEDSAQLFLGQRLQCAQCHHHPYEKWSQQDYYSFAAFFSQVGRKAGDHPSEEIIFARRAVPSATNKKTKQAVKPAGLGGAAIEVSADDDARQILADWMTSKDNRFFARAIVNRYWKHFFNRGLVDPEDDLRETNPPTNPELLDALAKNFVESGYDLKALVRTICRSQTYQLSAVPNEHNAVDRHNFSRYYPKRLTAEVLLDAVNSITGAETKFDGLPPGTRAVQLPDNAYNASSYFLSVFGRPEATSSCECERSQDASLSQSLHLLNAKDIQDKLANDQGRAALLAAASSRSDEEKLRELYVMAFSRSPNAEELAAATAHLARRTEGKTLGEIAAAKRHAYEDLIWALVNTKEFLFNH